ncbi:MAG: protein kinase [Candidatus Riflebacteria bacterium]|nr:protein kinase [Candidatus Riflebacteria bacterium]
MGEDLFSREFLREYEIVEELGFGGTARVFRARHLKLDRHVAIKLLSPLAFSEEDSRRRFDEESRLSSQLKHRNVVALLGTGTDSGRPYLVFEFVEGKTLRSVLMEQRRLSVPHTLRIAHDVASGLAAAHERKIIHRDLKPENVLIDGDGVAKITDFGLARGERPDNASLTLAGIFVGTPGYVPPEVILGQPATEAADVFSVGILIYEMLTGGLPFTGVVDSRLLHRYCREEFPTVAAAGVAAPEPVERLVALLLARDLRVRPSAAGRVAEMIQAVREEAPLPIGPGKAPATRLVSKPQGRPVERTRAIATGPGSAVAHRPAQQGRRDGRAGRRRLDTSTVVAAAGAVFVAVVLAFVLRPGRTPAVDPRLAGEPKISVGLTSARIRFQTDLEIPTRLWVWADDQGATRASLCRPAGTGSDPPRRDHDLVLSRLAPGTRYLFRVGFPKDRRSQDSYAFRLCGHASELVASPQVRFVVPDTLELSCENLSGLTAGIELAGAGAAPAIRWDSRPGPKPVGLSTTIYRAHPLTTARVRFAELDPDDAIPVASLGGYDTLRQVFIERMSQRENRDLSALTSRLTQLPQRDPELRRHLRPLGRRLVDGLDAKKKRELEIEAYRFLDVWFRDVLKLDRKTLASVVPLWLADPALSQDERHQVYQRVAWLNDIDGAGEMIVGRPLLDVESWAEPYVRFTRDRPIPTGGFRPLLGLKGTAAKVVRSYYLALCTRKPQVDPEGLLDAMNDMRVKRIGPIRRCCEEMALEEPQDSQDPLEPTRPWYDLGRLEPPLTGPFDVHLRCSNLEPHFRLWMRFGKNRLLCFRQPLARAKAFVSSSTDPDRSVIERESTTITAHLPRGFLTGADLDIAVRIDNFPVDGRRTDLAYHVFWFLDLAILPTS